MSTTYPAVTLHDTEDGSQFRELHKIAAFATQLRGQVSINVKRYFDNTYGVRLLGRGVERYAVRHDVRGPDLNALLMSTNWVLQRLYPADAVAAVVNY